MKIKYNKCCPDNSCSDNSCCEQAKTATTAKEKKEIIIDFLFLDLTVCARCQGTEANLDTAVDEVSAVLNAAGYKTVVNKINVNTRELAVRHRFLSSPTIRVNGRDIALEVKESLCTECGDLCGDSVDCRVWVEDGVEYTEPPKSMIINAILKEVYGGHHEMPSDNAPYELPDNLSAFFNGIEKKE